MGFKMKSKATAQAAKAATESSKGIKRFKFGENQKSAQLLILGSIKDDVSFIHTTKNHMYYSSKGNGSNCGTPSWVATKEGGKATGEEDKIIQTGWKLRDKYGESNNKKKKEFWRKCMPRTQQHVAVIDIKNPDAGPLVYSMPQDVANTVLEEIKLLDEEQDGDYTSICDFDEGRILTIKTNGKSGLARKYTSVSFRGEANLLADGIITEEMIGEFEEQMPDLMKLQLKYDEDQFEKHYNFLKKMASKLGIDFDDLEDEDEDDGDEYEEEEIESDDDEDEEEDLGVDEEELDMDDDDEELDIESDDEEDEEEELEEEIEEKPRKKKVRPSTTAKNKVRSSKKVRSKKARRRG